MYLLFRTGPLLITVPFGTERAFNLYKYFFYHYYYLYAIKFRAEACLILSTRFSVQYSQHPGVNCTILNEHYVLRISRKSSFDVFVHVREA